MKGLDLAEQFFREELFPALEKQDKELLDEAAFGLVGAGSECFGYDDEFSRDHDFTPLCCIWIRRGKWEKYAGRMKTVLLQLPAEYKGFPLSPPGGLTPGRKGLLDLESFYYGFLGCHGIPSGTEQWNRIPECYLSMAVNGKVFLDREGSFSELRRGLLDYYSKDIWLHKMAYACTRIAQAGQYNYLRCAKRGERMAAELAKAEFLEYAARLVYLLNRAYSPFYKWLYRGLGELDFLGKEVQAHIDKILLEREPERTAGEIEELCGLLYYGLSEHLPISQESGFFLEYAEALQSRIEDEDFRRRGAWAE